MLLAGLLTSPSDFIFTERFALLTLFSGSNPDASPSVSPSLDCCFALRSRSLSKRCFRQMQQMLQRTGTLAMARRC